uniref:C-type lectin domain-containing protein n=1 Tax=Oryzias latipes TaxID=8090 RepID=H2M2T7_ORYLA
MVTSVLQEKTSEKFFVVHLLCSIAHIVFFPGQMSLGHFCLFTCQLHEYHYVDQNMNWTGAQQHCRKEYTDLATVSTMADMEQLRNIHSEKTEIWIGLFNLTGINVTSHWSLPGLQFNESQAKWKSGEPDGFTSETCGAVIDITEKQWVDTSCMDKAHFLCYNDHVILVKENRTWEEALYYCRHHHHDLVTITNPEDQIWVQEKTKNASSPFVWTGLRYTCSLGFWFWVSDEVVRYKNWASPGQVNECDMSGAMETGGEHKWFKKHDEDKFNFFSSSTDSEKHIT